MAYCSVAVNAGSFNDPSQRQGLAHFMEHMLFMGSEKYPEENCYNDHLGAFGGFGNAYTEFEWTNYQFQVNYSGLKLAIDMLANNLAAPLMLGEAMDREINSIESEYQMCFPDDNVRYL